MRIRSEGYTRSVAPSLPPTGWVRAFPEFSVEAFGPSPSEAPIKSEICFPCEVGE